MEENHTSCEGIPGLAPHQERHLVHISPLFLGLIEGVPVTLPNPQMWMRRCCS